MRRYPHHTGAAVTLARRGAISHRLAGACRASWNVRVRPVGGVVMITSTAPLGVTT
jgi:hypothetical protein